MGCLRLCSGVFNYHLSAVCQSILGQICKWEVNSLWVWHWEVQWSKYFHIPEMLSWLFLNSYAYSIQLDIQSFKQGGCLMILSSAFISTDRDCLMSNGTNAMKICCSCDGFMVYMWLEGLANLDKGQWPLVTFCVWDCPLAGLQLHVFLFWLLTPAIPLPQLGTPVPCMGQL